MSDEPQQTHEPEPQPEEHEPTRTERIKQAVHDKIQSGENSKKISDAAHKAVETVKKVAENPRQTAHDVAEKVSTAAREAPRKAEGALFAFDSAYGKQSLTDSLIGAAGSDSIGGTFRKGVGRTVQGREQYDYDQAHPQEKGRPKSSPMMGRGMPNVMPTFGAPKKTSANIYAGNYSNFGFSAGKPFNFGMIGGQRSAPISFGFNRVSPVGFGMQTGNRPQAGGGFGMGFNFGFGLPRGQGGNAGGSLFNGKFALPLGINSKKKDKDGKERVSPLSMISSGKLNIFGRRVK